MGIGMRELVVILMVVGGLFLVIWPYSRIFGKAGYSGAFSILMVIPVVNLIALWVFAYSDWPALGKGAGTGGAGAA
jgi:ABC-type sugar transport system permease subunit